MGKKKREGGGGTEHKLTKQGGDHSDFGKDCLLFCRKKKASSFGPPWGEPWQMLRPSHPPREKRKYLKRGKLMNLSTKSGEENGNDEGGRKLTVPTQVGKECGKKWT